MTFDISDLSGDLEEMSVRLASRWPGIDSEDIAQEMTLKILENLDSVNGRPSDQDQRHLALGLARKRGVQYCSQERTEFQMNSAQWIYTPREIRSLLPSLFDGLAWEDAPKRPSNGRDYLEADGISILMMDMRAAYEALPEREQGLILTVFREGVAIPNASPDRKRLNRAIDHMTETLNREVFIRETAEHEGPGARDVLSNTRAAFRTASDY